MTKLSAALRQKFSTPQAAMEALGLDAALLEEETPMRKLSAPHAVAIRTALVDAKAAGKLALDANIEEIMPLIETLVEGFSNGNGGTEMLDAAPPELMTEPSSAVPMEEDWSMDEESAEDQARRTVRAADARRRLGRDETEEECAKREGEDSAADARDRLGRDETPEECAAREAKDQRRHAHDKRAIIPSAKDNTVVTKKALDAAMAQARNQGAADAIRIQREIRAAERAIRPYVGDLAMAHDSAEAVYRTALTVLGVKTEGVHPSAFQTILAMQPLAGARQPTNLALDSAGAKGFAERFPDTQRVDVI
jgi:hypothetical protein